MSAAQDVSLRTIVVGYDGSPPARAALTLARELAGASGRVVVVHAFGLPADWLGSPNLTEVMHHHQERGRQLLGELGLDPDAAAPIDGLEAELIGGSPAEALVDVARAHQADVIIVGSHGHGRVRAILGSVSHELLHLSDRPVIVIPTRFVADQRPSGHATA